MIDRVSNLTWKDKESAKKLFYQKSLDLDLHLTVYYCSHHVQTDRDFGNSRISKIQDEKVNHGQFCTSEFSFSLKYLRSCRILQNLAKLLQNFVSFVSWKWRSLSKHLSLVYLSDVINKFPKSLMLPVSKATQEF